MLSQAETMAKQRQLTRMKEDLRLLQEERRLLKRTRNSEDELRALKLIPEERSRLETTRQLEDDLRVQPIDLTVNEENEELDIKQEPNVDIVESEHLYEVHSSNIQRPTPGRPTFVPGSRPSSSLLIPGLQSANSTGLTNLFKQASSFVNSNNQALPSSQTDASRDQDGERAVLRLQIPDRSNAIKARPNQSQHTREGMAPSKIRKAKKKAPPLHPGVLSKEFSHFIKDPEDRSGKMCIELKCKVCRGNVTRDGTFVKGARGMHSHCRISHPDEFEGQSVEEIARQCRSGKPFPLGELRPAATLNARGRKVEKKMFCPMPRSSAHKYTNKSKRRDEDQGEVPSKRPKKSKSVAKPGSLAKTHTSIPATQTYEGKGKGRAQDLYQVYDDGDDDPDADQGFRHSPYPRRDYTSGQGGVDLGGGRESMVPQDPDSIPQHPLSDVPMCRRSSKPPVKQTSVGIEDDDEGGSIWDGRTARRRAFSGFGPAPQDTTAVPSFYESMRLNGLLGMAADTAVNEPEPNMSGGLPNLPVDASFTAPVARMTSQTPSPV